MSKRKWKRNLNAFLSSVITSWPFRRTLLDMHKDFPRARLHGVTVPEGYSKQLHTSIHTVPKNTTFSVRMCVLHAPIMTLRDISIQCRKCFRTKCTWTIHTFEGAMCHNDQGPLLKKVWFCRDISVFRPEYFPVSLSTKSCTPTQNSIDIHVLLHQDFVLSLLRKIRSKFRSNRVCIRLFENNLS